MIPKISKNKIRDLIEADIYTGEAGTGTTSPAITDTDLETPDATTENTVESTVSNQIINTRYIMYSNQGNGNIYNEMGLKFSDGTLFNRVVFPDFTKTSSGELHTTFITRIN